MIDLSSADREILTGLYASKKAVDLYLFHQDYLLSPGQISNFIRRFEKGRLVQLRDSNARLTLQGRRWVLKHRKHIFLKPKPREWAAPIQISESEKLAPLTPYMPVLSRVDFRFFLDYPVDDNSEV